MDKKTDLRVLRTRSSIKKAFFDLLKKKNYNKITIQDIAEEAFISRNTFYLHYLDKEDLLEKFVDECLNNLRESTETDQIIYSLDEFGYEEFFENNKRLFKTIEDNLETYKVILLELNSSYVTTQFTEMIVSHIVDGLKASKGMSTSYDKDIYLYAEYMASGLIGLIRYWIRNRDSHTVEEVSQILVDMYSQDLFKLLAEKLLKSD